MESVLKKFLQYVEVDSRSDIESKKRPSSEGQNQLHSLISAELEVMGGPQAAVNARMPDGSLLITLFATAGCEKAPHVVYAAHLDTFYGFPGGARPIIHHYQGGDIVLPHNNIVIPATDLSGLEGKTVITSDGTTLLGADDKAGVAALVTVLEELMTSGKPHGPFTIWFATDEEIGKLDPSDLPHNLVNDWDIFITVDGERVGQVDVCTPILRMFKVIFTGMQAHPAVSADKLRPAQIAGARFVTFVADHMDDPRNTARHEGFSYASGINGDASMCVIDCQIRTFDGKDAETLRILKTLAHRAAKQEGCEVVFEGEEECLATDIAGAIRAHEGLLAPLLLAHRDNGIEPVLTRTRGATDGSIINKTITNLPCPNVGIGAVNLHGPHEFLVAEELQLLVPILLTLTENYSRMEMSAEAKTSAT